MISRRQPFSANLESKKSRLKKMECTLNVVLVAIAENNFFFVFQIQLSPMAWNTNDHFNYEGAMVLPHVSTAFTCKKLALYYLCSQYIFSVPDILAENIILRKAFR